MKKSAVIFLVIPSLVCISFQCLAETSKGFSNAKDAKHLKEAWKNKSLLITFTDFERDFIGEKGACWEFNDFENAKVYIIKPDDSRILKATGAVELSEYINVDSPGYEPGQYVLQFIAVGYTFGTGFNEIIDPEVKSFKDTKQRLFEIRLQGCSKE